MQIDQCGRYKVEDDVSLLNDDMVEVIWRIYSIVFVLKYLISNEIHINHI